MLILTRRIGETLVIGEDAGIKVTVLGVKGNQVRLGVGAPKETAVHREEIYERIKSEEAERNTSSTSGRGTRTERISAQSSTVSGTTKEATTSALTDSEVAEIRQRLVTRDLEK